MKCHACDRERSENEIYCNILLRQNFGGTEKLHNYLILKPLQCPLQSMNTVPQGHEGDAEKKTKGASELRHKRGPGVDQHLRLDKSVVGQGMEAEQEVFGLVSCRMSVANNFVLQVLARFEAPSPLVNPIQVLH